MTDAAVQLMTMAAAYRNLTREVAALRIASPSAAIEALRRAMPTTQVAPPG